MDIYSQSEWTTIVKKRQERMIDSNFQIKFQRVIQAWAVTMLNKISLSHCSDINVYIEYARNNDGKACNQPRRFRNIFSVFSMLLFVIIVVADKEYRDVNFYSLWVQFLPAGLNWTEYRKLKTRNRTKRKKIK